MYFNLNLFQMDYNLLSKYEVIHETLSASESENEDNSTNNRKENGERRRVIKNFIICQPCGESKEKDDNHETKIKDWSAAVNSIGVGGPSMNTVNKVIGQTVCKVLQEEFPTTFKDIDAIRETSKKCPYCKFATLSRFSFRKHVAFHENKLQLVFTQGDFETSDTLRPEERKQYQCPNCFDLFRTETAMQFHRNCDCSGKMSPCAVSENRDNLPLKTDSSQIDEIEEPLIVTALKFLNRKSIDLEMEKESIPFANELEHIPDSVAGSLKSDNYMKPLLDMENRKVELSHNVRPSQDSLLACDMKEEVLDSGYNNENDEVSNEEEHEVVLENIKKEDVEENSGNYESVDDSGNTGYVVGNSYDDLERTMAFLTGQEENNNNDSDSQEIMSVSIPNPSYHQYPVGSDEFSVEIKDNELNNMSRSVQLPSVTENNVEASVPDNTIFKSKAINGDKVVEGMKGPIKVHILRPTLKELQASWRKSIESFQEVKEKEMIDEKSYVIRLIAKWKDSYKMAFPNSPNRCVIPGGVPCPNCDSNYNSFHLLLRHWSRIHDANCPVIHCPHCLYKTNQRELLRSHIKYRHKAPNENRKVYSCNMCEKTYVKSCSLVIHKLKNHSDQAEVAVLKCPYESCTYTTVDKKSLWKHRFHRHDHKDGFLCMYCGLHIKCKSTLIKHELMHKGCSGHQCSECKERFNHKLDLYSHKEIWHSKTPKQFKCELCEFITLRKELLVVHENLNHRKIKEFQCSECPLNFRDLELFEQHINRIHNPYLSWKYCAHCPYKSLLKPALVSHVVVHLPIKKAPIKCKLCKYRTYKAHYYIRHFNNKHNPNAIRYQCYHCGFVTKIKAKLHQHMQEKGHLLT